MAGINFFNSKECEWADMSVLIAGAPVTRIRQISYKAMKDKSLLHAAGDKPIGIQSGNRTYEGSIKLLKSAVDALNDAARVAGGEDLLDIEVDIVVVYRAKGSRLLRTDTLVNVQVKDFERGWEQGAKNMDVTLPILFTEII